MKKVIVILIFFLFFGQTGVCFAEQTDDYDFSDIQKELEKVVPLESVITKARQLENIHNLIKNNGKNFNLTQEELELANKLV